MGRKKSILFFISLFTIVLALIIAVLLYGNFTKEQKYGNSEGNIVNHLAHITKDDEYSYIALNNGIYKGTNIASLEKIAEGDYSYLNYMDGKLYGHDDKLGAIIEMNADGTEKKVLYQEGFVAGPWVVSNNIYFEDFDKNSFFRIKEGSGNLKEIEHKEGEWEQWIFSPAKDRDFEYSLWEKGFDLENSQHTEKAVYVLGQIENSSEIDGKLYCYEYGTEEGELLTEGIFQFNIAGNKIYYLISGENKSELCVMRMELDGSGKEKISKIILPEPVKAAGVGVGRDILYLSVALEPTGFEHIWFLVDIETGEYVQVMEDDTFVRPQ